MHPLIHATKRARFQAPYVCLSCRLHSSKSTLDADSIGPASLDQDGTSTTHNPTADDNNAQSLKRMLLRPDKISNTGRGSHRRRLTNRELVQRMGETQHTPLADEASHGYDPNSEENVAIRTIHAKDGPLVRRSQTSAPEAGHGRRDEGIFRKFKATDEEGRKLVGANRRGFTRPKGLKQPSYRNSAQDVPGEGENAGKEASPDLLTTAEPAIETESAGLKHVRLKDFKRKMETKGEDGGEGVQTAPLSTAKPEAPTGSRYTKMIKQMRLKELKQRVEMEEEDAETATLNIRRVSRRVRLNVGEHQPRYRRPNEDASYTVHHAGHAQQRYGNNLFISTTVARNDIGPVVRKQWGQPIVEKRHELAQEDAREGIDALMGAHRKTIEGETIDLAEVEDSVKSMRRRQKRAGAFRPGEEEQYQAMLPRYLQRREWRRRVVDVEGLGDGVVASEGIEGMGDKFDAGGQDELGNVKDEFSLSSGGLESDLEEAEELVARLQEMDNRQHQDGANDTPVPPDKYIDAGKGSEVDSNVSKYQPFIAQQDDSDVSKQPTKTSMEQKAASEKARTDHQPTPTPSLAPFRGMVWNNKRMTIDMSAPGTAHGLRARFIHTSRRASQQVAAATAELEFPPPPPFEISAKKTGIRAQLRKWQEMHGNNEEDSKNQLDFDSDQDMSGISNTLTRLPDPSSALRRQDREEEEERDAINQFMRSSTHDHDNVVDDGKFLKPGDLVELEFPMSERESIIAVFVRRLNVESQFFTSHGRWAMVPERQVQYSIPGWISPDLVKPILSFLPTPKNKQEIEEMREQAYIEDLSVPRSVAAPLVTRMVEFHAESQEIYRKYAGTLDRAHEILAHDTDLRYGSLVSAATTLLKMPRDKLPVTALFTVRSALSRAGFAFNIDRRSHRLTGYLQIRSKEQVKMVEYVRNWIREWQDDMAVRTALQGNTNALRKHKSGKGAQYVHSFVEKAKAIVLKSRETRDPSSSGNVGPSKTKLPITPSSDCVRSTKDTQFTEQDTELVRFMEAWACSGMFQGLPRLCALPPLILQAVGLYEEQSLESSTGFLFLQELGTIMPYENRIRFDQHLLLPSSQHSKPLQNLMSSLMEMKDKHNFNDSMKDLRHDWGDLPVYCIDDATAHEIDDGISIERAGSDEWWVHVHIANPTAFFERDHPLAKMARHMGESIYMPERTYMMLPRWTTSRHFSLAKDRPCLTFSTKMDGQGRTLEKKARSGFVRNVLRLTKDETDEVLDAKMAETKGEEEIVLTVGGDPPPAKPRQSNLDTITGRQREDLKVLRRLAIKRGEQRQAAGGVFFDAHLTTTEVWQNWKTPGLAWDHPHRLGSRTVEGDPVIQLRTKGFRNWFAPVYAPAEYLVREMMLLACETATSWCADRQIPVLYRGSAHDPTTPDPDWFKREFIEPAVKDSPDGAYPMHIGLDYIRTLGSTVLSTSPIRHNMLGMDHYGKVTSPLRRYGDMIIHWQVEAALREEARRGKSLETKNERADRGFLPFSANVLNTIMLGLQPREKLILHAKNYTLNFWQSLLLFRASQYGESPLPFQTPGNSSTVDPNTGKTLPLLRQYLSNENVVGDRVSGINMNLNVTCNMLLPEKYGLGGIRMGDVWECELDSVSVYYRSMTVKPVRLVERVEGTGLMI